MRISGPIPGRPESEGPKPIGRPIGGPISGKEGDFATSLKSLTQKSISQSISKLDGSITLETQRIGPEDFRVLYSVDQKAVKEVIEQLSNLKNLDLSQSLHVDQAINELKQLSNVADKSQDPDALDHINKAKKELGDSLK